MAQLIVSSAVTGNGQYLLIYSEADGYVAQFAKVHVPAFGSVIIDVPSGLYKFRSGTGPPTTLPPHQVGDDFISNVVLTSLTSYSFYGGRVNAVASVTANLPLVGTVSLPSWATDTQSASFFLGFAAAAGVRLFRAANKWFSRASDDRES